jgi:hypothetical protein
MLLMQRYGITPPKSLRTFSALLPPDYEFTVKNLREQISFTRKMMEKVPRFITQLHRFLMTSLRPQDPQFASLLQYTFYVP